MLDVRAVLDEIIESAKSAQAALADEQEGKLREEVKAIWLRGNLLYERVTTW